LLIGGQVNQAGRHARGGPGRRLHASLRLQPTRDADVMAGRRRSLGSPAGEDSSSSTRSGDHDDGIPCPLLQVPGAGQSSGAGAGQDGPRLLAAGGQEGRAGRSAELCLRGGLALQETISCTYGGGACSGFQNPAPVTTSCPRDDRRSGWDSSYPPVAVEARKVGGVHGCQAGAGGVVPANGAARRREVPGKVGRRFVADNNRIRLRVGGGLRSKS
jgi:hypothetical protein